MLPMPPSAPMDNPPISISSKPLNTVSGRFMCLKRSSSNRLTEVCLTPISFLLSIMSDTSESIPSKPPDAGKLYISIGRSVAFRISV